MFMEFKYVVENGEVIIIGYKDINVKTLIIPEYIDGYPVTYIGHHAFRECNLLENQIINNKFMLCNGFIYYIKHQIGIDYICIWYDEIRYFIGGKRCRNNFNKLI